MLVSELLKKEVVDKAGNTVGVVEDAVISQERGLTHIIVIQKGVLKVIKPTITIHIDDIKSISDMVILKVLKERLD